MPLTLNDAMWAKYKIGELLNVKDPKTNAPATRNIFRDNVPLRPGAHLRAGDHEARPHLRRVQHGAHGASAAWPRRKPGTTADKRKRNGTADLLPGVYLAPSGVYAVNRSQEAGCTYCYGG